MISSAPSANIDLKLWNHPTNEVEPPLRRTNSDRLTIGYGEGGGNPIAFEASDVGFLKLVVSDRYVDFSRAESPEYNRVQQRELKVSTEIEILGTWVVGIVAPN